MPLVDFKEIPQANSGNGDQDTFELFAEEFLRKILNFEIVSSPNRGADGGKDIIAIEHQTGDLSRTDVKWLISCKHNAFSGKSVSEQDESNISDRLAQHQANGFIGFYSTLPSSGLNNRFDALKGKYKIEVFNKERIESYLLKNAGVELLKRFFPASFEKINHKKPANVFSKYEELVCEHCKKDLLKTDSQSIIVFIEDPHKNEIVDVYTACKGGCDHSLLHSYRPEGFIDTWEDLYMFKNPTLFMSKVMAIVNNIYSGDQKFTPEAFEKLKIVLLRLSQTVLREQTEEEKERAIENIKYSHTLF